METVKHRNTNQRNKESVDSRDNKAIKEKVANRKEIEAILSNAKKSKEAQTVLGIAGQHAGLLPKELQLPPPIGEIQNPGLAYKLYYRTLGRLRRYYFVKNPEIEVPEKARKELNKEIRVFLKEGKSQADSRMATTKRMSDAVKIFVDWSDDCLASDIANLYGRFCEANDVFEKRKKKD